MHQNCLETGTWGECHLPKKSAFKLNHRVHKDALVPLEQTTPTTPATTSEGRVISCTRVASQTASEPWQRCLHSANFITAQQRCSLHQRRSSLRANGSFPTWFGSYPTAHWRQQLACVFRPFSSWMFAQILPGYRRKPRETPAQLEAWIPVSWLRLIPAAQSCGPLCSQVTVQTDSRCFEADENKS